jgi:hypothetical protein
VLVSAWLSGERPALHPSTGGGCRQHRRHPAPRDFAIWVHFWVHSRTVGDTWIGSRSHDSTERRNDRDARWPHLLVDDKWVTVFIADPDGKHRAVKGRSADLVEVPGCVPGELIRRRRGSDTTATPPASTEGRVATVSLRSTGRTIIRYDRCMAPPEKPAADICPICKGSRFVCENHRRLSWPRRVRLRRWRSVSVLQSGRAAGDA